MAKSIKFKNDTYLDSTSIVHNKSKLSDKLLLPYVLYENKTGEISVTLNDDLSNYYRIDVELLMSGTNYYETRTIYFPNNKSWIFSRSEADMVNKQWYIMLNIYTNSGKNITCDHKGVFIGHSNTFTSNNNMRITKVIGYK